MKDIHVNIYDLEHYDRLHEIGHADRAALRRFATVKELAKYSKKGKIYPRDKAKAKGALRFMLRGCFVPTGLRYEVSIESGMYEITTAPGLDVFITGGSASIGT